MGTDLPTAAYHEAGHVVVGHRVGLHAIGVEVAKVGNRAGTYEFLGPPDWYDPGPHCDERTRDYAESLSLMDWAGPAAQARYTEEWDHVGATDDQANVFERARKIAIDTNEAIAYVERARCRSVGLVDRYWSQITAVANALVVSTDQMLVRSEILTLLGEA